MSFASMHNDYLSPPDDDRAVQLDQNKTLIGYGRQGHGLNGKDADLDYGGQLVVNSAWWIETGKIEVDATAYASICHASRDEFASEGEFDTYMDEATEIVCGSNYEGSYDGDYWVLTFPISLRLELEWDDDEPNIAAACALVHDRLIEAAEPFATKMTELAKALQRK